MPNPKVTAPAASSVDRAASRLVRAFGFGAPIEAAQRIAQMVRLEDRAQAKLGLEVLRAVNDLLSNKSGMKSR